MYRRSISGRSSRSTLIETKYCFRIARSEEHTSELQSPCNFVCRLLLEKKKNNALDVLNRVPGVADVTMFCARDYSRRNWPRPDTMVQLGIIATDVASASRAPRSLSPAG